MKKILFLLVLLFPILINASCDYSKLDEYNKLSSNIDYELNYDTNSKKYNVTFSNVYEKIYIVHNEKIYMANSKNEITIKNIDEGVYLDIRIYAPLEDCDSFIRTIKVVTKYYNQFYNTKECENYKKDLNICKEEFLTYKPNIDLLNSAIENYKKSYKEEEKSRESIVEEHTILENIKEFIMNWGIQLTVGLIVSIITVIFFKAKFRKIKHGI